MQIFEVNASCQRNGRQILSQLKEATQSHQVDKKGINAHKPCFFNSCSSAKSPSKFPGYIWVFLFGWGFHFVCFVVGTEFPKQFLDISCLKKVANFSLSGHNNRNALLVNATRCQIKS